MKLIILMYVAWSFIIRYSRGDVIDLPFKTYAQCYLIPKVEAKVALNFVSAAQLRHPSSYKSN